MIATDTVMPGGGLDAVRRLEHALDDRDDAHDRAVAAVGAARAEAERLLAAARAAGVDAGRRRRAALLAEAEREAETIRAAARSDAARLLQRSAEMRDELVAEFTALLLPDRG
jgi:cell division septum initiation protein DivIVA